MEQAQAQSAAREDATLAFKRHILTQSSGFAAEPMADLFRVNLLGQMLDRYDALRAKGMGEISSVSRVQYEFSDIAQQMRDAGFEETAQRTEDVPLSRWPALTEEEAERFIHENDDYLHRIAMGSAMCSACVMPLMIGAAFSEFWYSDAFSLMGLVGMFVMIGLGVYSIATAVKPKRQKDIKKGRFSLGSRLRRKLTQMREEVERKARRRRGKGIALLTTCVIPIFIGAAMSEMWFSDGWPVLGVAGMFVMIGAGVYELVMADGEKKVMKQLLDQKEE